MTERIENLQLVENSTRRSAEAEHERNIALTDLKHENSFSLSGAPSGPYNVVMKTEENRMVLEVEGQGGAQQRIMLPTTALKKTIRDYFLICESYYAALKENKPHKLESIDMGRRGVHNEGAEMLQEMLAGKVEMDFATARRLFTLVAVLHLK